MKENRKMHDEIRVTIWNEFRHEQKDRAVIEIYPEGIHSVLAKNLSGPGIACETATLDEPDHGLLKKRLAHTDVLIWWGHTAHHEVRDEVVERVYKRVLEGMGLIVLHSSHFSKIFKKLMGTECTLRWREDGRKERLWNIDPGHPIAQGLGPYFELPRTEMYGERFDIPQPDRVVFISWFEGGELFRSGCCWERGHGRIFYFRPGHETYPIFHDENVIRVLRNAIHWARPRGIFPDLGCPMVRPLEKR
ncbi:MAG: ThuA domain-containing protein [Planctomycetota bacterium]